MFGWALTFFIIALIAAGLGFGGIAGASAGVAQILFFVFLVLFALSLVMRVFGHAGRAQITSRARTRAMAKARASAIRSRAALCAGRVACARSS